ncbi:MAG: family 78 glycoside hydrolase catalytic domain [Clostridia bacterium]|nr:family 78 glycoside hydrolase catalytic domain [Clostridia bacterium]
MKNPIYSANFITAGKKWVPVSPYFKKNVALRGEVRRAMLHISSLGVFEAKINGVRVGEDYMTPGWTSYYKRLQYFTYDVTDMLQGRCEIVVGVGNGWYSSRGGFIHTKDGMYGHSPALIAALEIEYKNGESEVVITDESWQIARSECLFSGIYDGEIYDATAVPVYENNAEILDFDKSVLIPLEGECTREIERVSVKEIITTPKGETVLDFGQEITGTIEFRLTARGGETVRVLHGEVLDNEGNFYNANYRTARAEIVYTARAGEQSYKAIYTFFGFRYVKLENWCCEVKKEDFTAIVLHSDMKRTGYFSSGHRKLNQLYSNIIWGQRDNFLDVPTDCPQRDERLGWTGDAEVFARTASINYDTEKFYTKWLRDVIAEQFENGAIPRVVPDVLRDEKNQCSAAWGDAACVIPWELYLAYGNKRLLREHIPLMKKWVGYQYSDGAERYLWLGGKHFGDWLGLDAPTGSYTGSTSKDLIASAYFYLSTSLLIKALDALGMKSDRYKNMASRIRRAYQKEFIKRGRLTSDTQTAHVVTIHFGLVDDKPELKERLGRRLVELIEANGDRLQTGFVGTPYLLDTLTEIGRADKAYTLLLQEKFPSWLFSVNMGATTIWEHWDSVNERGEMWSTDMNSFNHYAYGSVASWLYGTVLGIKPTSPAYATFELSPIPNRALGHARCCIETRSGTVRSAWAYGDGEIRYTFEVPEGTRAHLKLTDGTDRLLDGGKYTFITPID